MSGGTKNWKGSPYAAQTRAESIAETREFMEKLRKDRVHKATYCQCERPIPSLSSYEGWKICRMCQRLIFKGGA